MGFWSLFVVASMPTLQVLIISGLGAFLATGYCCILSTDARRSLNKIVFTIFTPSLVFASLARTVTLSEIITWWFMPVNVGLTFLIGGILGNIAVKLLKPGVHLEGLTIASCSAANLGNLVLVIVPAICHQDGSPFGDRAACEAIGFSYSSFSMALGGFFIWTYTYQVVKGSVEKVKALEAAEEDSMGPNRDLEENGKTHLLKGEIQENSARNQVIACPKNEDLPYWRRIIEVLHQLLHELMSPPFLASVFGLLFGAVPWLKNLLIGEHAPLAVIQDCIKLLGDGTIPSITLILGGNLTQGLQSSKVKGKVVIGIIFVKFLMLPVIGIGVVKLASMCGFLPTEPLYHFVLMLQFSLPPAMNIGTMTQLFEVGQEECSVILLYTYTFAALALTFWCTVFMWILS